MSHDPPCPSGVPLEIISRASPRCELRGASGLVGYGRWRSLPGLRPQFPASGLLGRSGVSQHRFAIVVFLLTSQCACWTWRMCLGWLAPTASRHGGHSGAVDNGRNAMDATTFRASLELRIRSRPRAHWTVAADLPLLITFAPRVWRSRQASLRSLRPLSNEFERPDKGAPPRSL